MLKDLKEKVVVRKKKEHCTGMSVKIWRIRSVVEMSVRLGLSVSCNSSLLF